MRKGILSFGVGLVIALGAFWLWQPSAPQNVTSGELPKKEFAKEPIELPAELVMTSSSIKLEEESKEKVQTYTTVHTPEPKQPTKGDFLQIADHFMDEIVQPADDEYKVMTFTTKQQLVEYLSQYSSPEIARYYVDGLYEEKNGELYIIPTELPPWIIMGEPADLTEVSEENYTLTQINKSDLYGNYKINLTFKEQDGKWKINDVEYTYN
ncbi:hypothetical protein [Alkalihalobacillus sp. AL-G]|uniref:hypothetical protein n=1 Tax=Alkalihalobacillus sp. AL-G TaxID=2926399 RepID=UPI00272DA01F|nr:hypothetical protein [Alkalihalobacillus sp. AL-G]WLD92464.1 hypothetical protein MOJ78_15795 [Alkalihalobacillus sp. AL-G]